MAKAGLPRLTQKGYDKLVNDLADKYLEEFRTDLSRTDDKKAYWLCYRKKIENDIVDSLPNIIIPNAEFGQPIIFEPISYSQAFKILVKFCKENKIPHPDKYQRNYALYQAFHIVLNELDFNYRKVVPMEVYEPSEYAIVTSRVYSDTREKYKGFKYDLLIDLELALKAILKSEPADTYEPYYLERYQNELVRSLDTEAFPFPRYYVRNYGKRNEAFCSVISFDEIHVTVYRDCKDFDLLFALQLYSIDIMGAKKFLEYQLQENFEDDKEEYTEFLETISIKYHDFLAPKYTAIIKQYIDKNIATGKKKKINKELITKGQRILMASFLIKEIVKDVDQLTLAKIAAYLVEGAIPEQIKNSYVYRTISGFHSRGKDVKLGDLNAIKDALTRFNLANPEILYEIDMMAKYSQKSDSK
jgi:hypothetical protein